MFGRKASLLVGDLDVTQLRFSFTVEKHLRKEPNTAKVSVWNISRENRARLEGREKGVPVELMAGYERTHLLFRGLLDVALSEKDGADWITNVYSDDGKKALKTRAAVSYRGGVDVKKVIQDLAKEMDLGVGNLLALIQGGSIPEIGSALPHGLSAKGAPADALFGLLSDMGINASIQDGELQGAPKGKPTSLSGTVLRWDTGLIGNPAVDRKGRIEGRALLIPEIRPGAAISVESDTATGQWVVDSVTYVGDTAGTDWYAEFEGAPL